MSEQEEHQNAENVGLGIKSLTPIKASNERVWAAMVDKMYNTDKYLPVTNVQTTNVIPGQSAHRKMFLHGQLFEEDICFDKSRYEIRAEKNGADQVHVNIYYPDTGLLEYWQENKKGERTLWEVPKSAVLSAMEKTKEEAEASK